MNELPTSGATKRSIWPLTCLLLVVLVSCPQEKSTEDYDENEQPVVFDATGFVGYWTNENASTSGHTHFDISINGSDMLVHMWGKCHPIDCDNGELSTPVANAEDGVVSLLWTKSFKTEDQELSVLNGGRLRVKGYVHFTDNSGRPDYGYTEYFSK